jgi:hypothetical protein
MNDRDLEELRGQYSTAPDKPELALALARELAHRGDAAGSVAALRPALARRPTDAGLRGELLARSPRLRAPWPAPLGAGTSRASACARGARRARVHRRFFTEGDRGPPLVLQGGLVLRAGDGVLEEIDLESDRVHQVTVAGLRVGALRLVEEGMILARGEAGLLLLEGRARTPHVIDKGAIPSEPRAVYVGPSGGTAVGRGPQVRALTPTGEASSTRPLPPRSCKRSAVLGGGESDQDRMASGFAGDPLGELWIEVQEPFLSVESKDGYPNEVVRYATSVEWWPQGHLPSRVPLTTEPDQVERLIAGPGGEPIVVVPVALPSLRTEAEYQGGGAAVAKLGPLAPVAYDAPRRRVIVGGPTELAVVPLVGPRSAIPVGAMALACDVEGWIYGLSQREDGVRIVCVDQTGRAIGGPAFAGATDLAIGDGVTIAYGPRALYAIA